MQKVDIAIAAVGAFALLATGLGVVFYDDINNLNEYTVESRAVDFDASGAVPAGGASFDVDVPDNMYHAAMDITISFASQNPAASCTIDASVTVTTPDGSEVTETGSFQFSSGSGVINVQSAKFGDAPDDFTGDADDKADKSLMWDEPLNIALTVQDSGCGAPVIGVGGATYSAAVAGTFHGFAILGGEPDVGAV